MKFYKLKFQFTCDARNEYDVTLEVKDKMVTTATVQKFNKGPFLATTIYPDTDAATIRAISPAGVVFTILWEFGNNDIIVSQMAPVVLQKTPTVVNFDPSRHHAVWLDVRNH